MLSVIICKSMDMFTDLMTISSWLNLPWQGLKAHTKKQKCDKIRETKTLTPKEDIRDMFSGAVGAFARRNVSGSGRHGEHSRHKTSDDIPSSKDVQADSERGRTSRNCSSSRRATISSSRPSSSGEPTDSRSSSILVSSSGR
ncbi:hypothetical protein RND71_013488 [Anisodus tanguticus]|uniref:Uncharacterized protein n=1 Tax=Anisodus tanguticus TaxID=243964 RepID=A0AAE1S818_9SOLA|nr:hypothetical protein RND71_013488 [Anisodus tanguticus]